MRSGATVSIDSAGRIVVPKPLRVAAGLVGGAQLEIRLTDEGGLELRPVAPDRALRRTRNWVVIDEPATGPTLTEAEVGRVRARLRERGR